MLMAAVKRKIPFWGYVSNLVMVTLGNFVGSLLIAGLLGVSTGIFDSPASKTCESLSSLSHGLDTNIL
jgi:formate/nitrite transporter FocA (FNT family)